MSRKGAIEKDNPKKDARTMPIPRAKDNCMIVKCINFTFNEVFFV